MKISYEVKLIIPFGKLENLFLAVEPGRTTKHLSSVQVGLLRTRISRSTS